MPDRSRYQISSGIPRRVYGARQCAERAAHDLVIQTTEGATAGGEPHRWWITDLRRGRVHIYGGLFRFLEFLHRRGVSKSTALLIPEWVTSFINELWGDAPEERAERPALKRVA